MVSRFAATKSYATAQIQASWQFKHEASLCTLLLFPTSDQRVALIEAGTIMPARFERRNARLYLCSARRLEKGVVAPSRLGETAGE
jgi:hypothetical protein